MLHCSIDESLPLAYYDVNTVDANKKSRIG